MKTLFVALSLAALSLTGCAKTDPTEGAPAARGAAADAQAAGARHTVAIKGAFATLASPAADQAGVPAGSLRLVVTGTGTVSHLGRSSYEDRTLVNLTNGTAAGTHTLTAANGDQLFATLAVVLTPRGDGTSTVAVRFTVTGGTGRFTGATGHYDGRDILNPASPAGFLTIAGEITY